jgi:hypothetical protein
MVKRRKPPVRLITERTDDNQKRALRTPAPSMADRALLAARLAYAGSAKHKLKPRAFGLDPAPRDADDTLCDGHAGVTPEDMPRLLPLLKRGVIAGLIGQNDKQGDPTIVWAIDDNGWIYEARITTPSQAIYHGYPLLPADAFAKKVIARYRTWAYQQNRADLIQIYTNALDRYP